MKILFVCRYKEKLRNHISPFVSEQAETLRKQGCDVECFLVEGNGLLAYFKALSPLKRKIREFKPDVVHAHYGLCGLTANLQKKVPVVTTYHGSDINNKKTRIFSKFAIRRSAFNVFVSQKNIDVVEPKSDYRLLPCGINIEEFGLIEKQFARNIMGLESDKKYVLFASSFNNEVKDPRLALAVCKTIPEVTLLEMKGYSRQEVINLMYACDALLMTSHSEGSPQVIKEAMACDLPIVSTDVGDVSWVTKGIDGCYVAESRETDELAALLRRAIDYEGRTCGKQRIVDLGLTNTHVAQVLISEIYSSLVK